MESYKCRTYELNNLHPLMRDTNFAVFKSRLLSLLFFLGFQIKIKKEKQNYVIYAKRS